MKTPERSRFGKLVAYLVDAQGKNIRVGEVTITNCVSTELSWAVREIVATQGLNSRAKSDRTYHLLISMRAGEDPDPATLKAIEERFCKELGYTEHQRISVVHRDTDNVHIHVAINKIHPKTLTLHDPVRDYKKRSKLCAILEHELGLAQDNHQRGQTRGNDVTPKSGQESFQAWLSKYAQSLVDATSWEEFHGIADAYSVKLQLRTNGFVFTDTASGIHVKASAVHRQLGRGALEARLGTFVDAEGIKAQRIAAYEKKPAFSDTTQLWREYETQRDLRTGIYYAKHQLINIRSIEQIEAAKTLARDKRHVAKLTSKGVTRQLRYAAIRIELRQAIRAIKERAREQRKELAGQTRKFTWIDWLQLEAQNGRVDAMNALRAARRVPTAPKTLTPHDTSLEPAPAPAGAQVTKQGTIIDTVAGYEIREDHEGVYIAPNAPDDALLAMLRRTIERHGSTLSTYGPDDFQLRLAKVAGINHLSVCFEDAAIEQARQAARAAAPVPISRAALQYIAERNSKRDRISDIAFHRLWQAADAGELEFTGLRVVENQNLLLLSNGNETLVLPITPQQRRQLAPQPRGTRLTVSAEVVIQTPIQGLER